MNNILINQAEQAIVDIEFSNMDAHKKGNAKAVLHALIQLCVRCCQENSCDTCKFKIKLNRYK